VNVGNFTYYSRNNTASGVFTGSASGTVDYSIIAEHRIAATEFNAFSDARIKQLVGLSDSQKDLDIISRLRVTDYYPVDKAGEGTQLRKGFIAQEVEKIIPEAVSQSTRIVQDIYALPTSFEYDPGTRSLTVTLSKNHNLKKGDKV